MTLSEPKNKLALGLYDIGAIKFGAFRLKHHETNPDAPLSPFYVDLRLIRSFPKLMDIATDLYIEVTRQSEFALVADVPTAGTPIAAIISHKLAIPMVTPRIEIKGHGDPARVQGVWTVGQRCLVIDDLITTAASKIEAIKVLESGGLVVRDIAVLVDRGQGGREHLEAAGYRCWAVFNLPDLIRRYQEVGYLSEERASTALAYIKSNRV
jgi:uridine monophosphate synthetase